MAWFKRDKPNGEGLPRVEDAERRVRTEGLWQKCDGCRQITWKKELADNWNICPKCGHHFRIDAATRLKLLFDDEFQVFDDTLSSSDPLRFVDKQAYRDKLRATQESTKRSDALVAASGTLDGREVEICAMEYAFIAGSMGSVVGEKIARSIDRCLQKKCPLVIVSASSGARMQEGAVRLMQLDEAKLPYISVLTDPTTGGVTASYAMLGDLNIAEPGALIGFAGPRV